MEQQQQHAKVERFLKLGYSQGDILRVLESLRHDAQTNDILEELIKTCHTRSHGNKSIPGSPKLVSRGCSPCPSPTRAVPEREPASAFRPVVIDGSNVAMSHGNKKVFSCQGLQLAVNWFWDRGLRDITVFIPLWRKEQPRPEALITDQHILHELERRKILVYTPSRCVNGKRVVCYDDRYIVKLAFDSDGIIVSNDNYRDLQTENPQWKKFIEERLLMYTFANDKFMPPDDPLGRNGPNIDDFLRKKPWIPDNKQQHCPYGKKCTYGVKCKFYHPERANQSQLSVADELRDRARNLQEPAGHGCSTPPPLALSTEEHYHRELYPAGPDVDEAFGSLESSLSRLYIQDAGCGAELQPHSCSSGVASCSLGHDDYASFSGSYSGSSHKLCSGGGGGYYPQGCEQCRYSQWPGSMCPQQHQQLHQQQHQQPVWSSCPPLPPHASRPCSDRHQACSRQSHSLPREPWAGSPASEQRSGLRSKLSTLFPQSTVEQVMNAYPHISDTFQLISLIQRNRSHFS